MKIKPFKPLIGTLAGLLALAAMLHAAPLKLDFGTTSSTVFPGFTGVSNKDMISSEAKFGFVKAAPSAYNQLRPNALAGDFVYSDKKSTFQVNLPDGNYKAWFLYGDSRYTERVLRPLPMKYQISINGKIAVSDPIDGWKEFFTEKYFYRGYSYIYHTNSDFYDKYVAPNFREATVAFEVDGGKVLFTLEDIPLNAMIIYPADEATKTEKNIAYLHKELRRHTIIREVKPTLLDPAPVYSDADKKQGYVTYSRGATEPPLPADRPLKEELGSAPSAFVARGEKTDLSVSVLPLRDLQNVKVTVSDLSDKASGARIAAKTIDVQYVAQQEVAIEQKNVKTAAYTYEVKPTFIKPLPANFVLMDEGINRTILLTVHTSQNTQPGTYEGTLTIAPQNAPASKVLLTVRVLPITLPELPIIAGRYALDHVYYYNYYWTKFIRSDDYEQFVWERQKKSMQWVKDMGLNSIAWCEAARGDFLDDSVQLDPNGRVVKWMDLYRDMGFKAMPWYGFQAISNSKTRENLGKDRFSPEWTAKYRQMIEGIRDLGKARNWPEIIFYLSDELSNDGPEGGEDGLKRIAASDGIPGIRRISSVNGKYERAMIGGTDIIMPNTEFPITQETLDEMKEKGTEFWAYNIGENRFSWGYYLFRTQAKGRFQWFQNAGYGYPFNEFDSTASDKRYSAFVDGPDGPISHIRAIHMREGLVDLRYVTLMKTLMAQNKNPQSKAMQDANAILKEINALSADLRTYARGSVDAEETDFDANDTLWSFEKCDKMRWRVAQAIMGLQEYGN